MVLFTGWDGTSLGREQSLRRRGISLGQFLIMPSRDQFNARLSQVRIRSLGRMSTWDILSTYLTFPDDDLTWAFDTQSWPSGWLARAHLPERI